MKTEFAKIVAKKITITEGQFMKTISGALFLKNCTLNIEKASIEFSRTTEKKKITKILNL